MTKPQSMPQDLSSLTRKLIAILSSKKGPEVRIQEALRVLTQVQTEDKEHSRKRENSIGSICAEVMSDIGDKPCKGDTNNQRQAPFLIGESSVMQNVYESIERVANSQATVLIRGESGTGKELVAKAIHGSSRRRGEAFIPVHCAAVPDSLIESTLFGYERGAFTGAIQMRKGKIEQASGGTLFLDEVGDIPLSTQVKLLRVIQEREYERVGGAHQLVADVRIVAATHRDLEAMVTSGTFREDLYYRLNVVPLVLPPLRERKEDIPSLVKCFIDRFNHENRRHIQIDAEVMSVLARYHWPGNIRELQNCIERLVVLADSITVTVSAIPKPLKSYIDHIRDVTSVPRMAASPQSGETLPRDVHILERDRLVEVLQEVGWVKTKAGRILGLTPRQVAYKMKKYEIH